MAARTSTIKHRVRFAAPPAVIYRALMDARKHAAFTQAPAKIDARPGGAMTAYGGYISGTFLTLQPGRGFTQRWRTTEFPGGADDSLLVIRLAREGNGTRLTMVQTGVPRASAAAYDAGWHEHYWEPLREWIKRQ